MRNLLLPLCILISACNSSSDAETAAPSTCLQGLFQDEFTHREELPPRDTLEFTNAGSLCAVKYVRAYNGCTVYGTYQLNTADSGIINVEIDHEQSSDASVCMAGGAPLPDISECRYDQYSNNSIFVGCSNEGIILQIFGNFERTD